MINSVKEFLALIEQDDADSSFRIINDHADEQTWLSIIAECQDCHRQIAFNVNLPIVALAALAKSKDSNARFLIAGRRALPIELKELLSRDADESVRARIASNKKTPADILNRLAKDPSPLVSAAANERISTTKAGK